MEAESPPNARQVAEAVLLDSPRRAKLLGYARARFGIGPEDAEDLLQDTALELLRQRGYVRNPDGFVFAVFRNRCGHFSEARSLSRERFRGETEADESIPDPLGPEKIDRQVALREALNGISSSCRRLLSAYYVEGRSLDEAARGLAVTYTVASRRVSRCLKRLRACLN